MEEENIKKQGNAKCRGAIWVLGQCYVVNGDEVEKNIYYEEVRELAFAQFFFYLRNYMT